MAYLVSEVVDPGSGVGRKIRSQLEAWRASGVRTLLAVMAGSEGRAAAWTTEEPGAVMTQTVGDAPLVSRELMRQRAGLGLGLGIRRWAPDLTYVRFGPFHLGEELVRRTGPVALEFNSDDLAEYRRRPSLLLYHRLTRRRMLAASRAAFAPTAAVAEAMSPAVSCVVDVITNGVDVRGIDRLGPNSGPPAIAFLAGSAAPRQGIDKVLTLAALLPEIHFHVVAPVEPPREEQPNVDFHGFLDRQRYTAVLEQCDVALGTLALHRQGMAEAAPLKVREYLAMGLPVVVAHSDPDRELMGDWAYEIPNTEDNVRAAAVEIKQFLNRHRGTRVPASVGAAFDHSAKEAGRLQRLLTIIGAP